MKRFSVLLICLMAVTTLSLTACGGGGGGGGGAAGSNTTIGNFTAVLLDFMTGGTFSTATDINNTNLVAGYSDDALGGLKGTSWSVDVVAGTVGAPTQLDPLAGGTNNYSAAFAATDAGTIVGESDDGSNFTAVVWAAGSSTATALQKGTHTITSAYAINTFGQIVGEGGSGGTTMALLWNDSTAAPTTLGNLPGGTTSSAYHISDGGIVVGEADDGTEMHAVAWAVTAGGAVNGPLDLGKLDPFDLSSAAFSANDLGEIVGESVSSSGVIHAVQWTVDPAGNILTMTNLGTIAADSGAYANNLGNRIVGYNAETGTAMATAWDNRAPAVSKDILASTNLSQAFGLNEANLAVGVDGTQAFVAIPQ